MVVNRKYCLLGCDAVWSGRGLLSFRGKKLAAYYFQSQNSSPCHLQISIRIQKRYVPEDNFSSLKSFKCCSFG